MKSILHIGSWIILTAVVLGEAQGSVIYNSFGPGQTYSTNTWNLGYFNPGNGTCALCGAVGFNFTPAVSGILTSVELPIQWDSGTQALEVDLRSDAGNSPGSIIESFNFTSGFPGIVTGTSVLHPTLNAGIQYWLTANATSTSGAGEWFIQLSGPSEERARNVLGVWNITSPTRGGAFELDGTALTATPEPSTLFLLVMGIAVMGVMGTIRTFTTRRDHSVALDENS